MERRALNRVLQQLLILDAPKVPWWIWWCMHIYEVSSGQPISPPAIRSWCWHVCYLYTQRDYLGKRLDMPECNHMGMKLCNTIIIWYFYIYIYVYYCMSILQHVEIHRHYKIYIVNVTAHTWFIPNCRCMKRSKFLLGSAASANAFSWLVIQQHLWISTIGGPGWHKEKLNVSGNRRKETEWTSWLHQGLRFLAKSLRKLFVLSSAMSSVFVLCIYHFLYHSSHDPCN